MRYAWRKAAHEGLARVPTPLLDWTSATQLSRTWASGDEEALCEVARLLGQAGLTIDAVMAQTLAARIDDVQRPRAVRDADAPSARSTPRAAKPARRRRRNKV
jgi:hypothetical protein